MKKTSYLCSKLMEPTFHDKEQHSMNRIVTLMTILIANIAGMSAQTKEVIDELNQRGFWMPYVAYLEDDSRMEYYLRTLDDYSRSSISGTRRAIEEEHARAQAVLKARKDICGKKKGKKADALLAKHFDNVEQAKRAFDNAEQAERRYNTLARALDDYLAHAVQKKMPGGRLLSFSYHTSNGFAGYRLEVTLERKTADSPGTLKFDEKRMRMRPDQEEKESVDVAVDDSVFVRVRDMVEQGELYDVGRRYEPDIDIMDASGWSMDFRFEKGTIDSGGYAVGPDHHDTLNEVLRYLEGLYKELTEGDAEEQNDSADNEKKDAKP